MLRSGQGLKVLEGNHEVVVIVLVSGGNEAASPWSSLTWRLVPQSTDNEREQRVHVRRSALMTETSTCTSGSVCSSVLILEGCLTKPNKEITFFLPHILSARHSRDVVQILMILLCGKS